VLLLSLAGLTSMHTIPLPTAMRHGGSKTEIAKHSSAWLATRYIIILSQHAAEAQETGHSTMV